MSRNASGIYTLPSAVNPVVTNTQITTNWANTTLNDIASEITNSLDRNGRGKMNVPMLMLDGNVVTPAYSFTNDPDSGMYHYGSGKLGFAVNGVLQLLLGNSGVEGTFNVPTQLPSDSSTKVASTAFVQSVAMTAALPNQAGNAGKIVTTDGVTASWAYLNLATQTNESLLYARQINWTNDGAQITASPDQAGGFKNLLHNSLFTVEVRTLPASVGAATLTYLTDRWKLFNNCAAVLQPSLNSDVPNVLGTTDSRFMSSLRLTVTTQDSVIAPSDYCLIRQTIEGTNIRRLRGRVFTISFWVRSSVTGTYTVAIDNSVNATYVATYTVNAANTWEYKTITIPGGIGTVGVWGYLASSPTYISWCLMCGTTGLSANPDAWTAFSAKYGVAGMANAVGTIGNIFAICAPQIEAGSVATPIELRDQAIEEMICRRYFQILQHAHGDPAVTASTRYTGVRWTDMRTTPSPGSRTQLTADVNISSVAFADTTVRGARIGITPTAANPIFMSSTWPLDADFV